MHVARRDVDRRAGGACLACADGTGTIGKRARHRRRLEVGSWRRGAIVGCLRRPSATSRSGPTLPGWHPSPEGARGRVADSASGARGPFAEVPNGAEPDENLRPMTGFPAATSRWRNSSAGSSSQKAPRSNAWHYRGFRPDLRLPDMQERCSKSRAEHLGCRRLPSIARSRSRLFSARPGSTQHRPDPRAIDRIPERRRYCGPGRRKGFVHPRRAAHGRDDPAYRRGPERILERRGEA